MADKRTILIIAGGQMKGLGSTLKALDPDNTGTDDLAGAILNAGGSVVIAAALDNLKGQRAAVTTVRDIAQEWLDNNAPGPV